MGPTEIELRNAEYLLSLYILIEIEKEPFKVSESG